MARTFALAAILACPCALAAAQPQPSMTIVEDSLPPLSTGMDYHVMLHATGIAPPFTWSIIEGDPPAGISLSPEGCLCGRPIKPGPFDITVKVDDSGHPPHSVTKEFHVTVSTALLLEWLDPPKVRDGSIDGSVQVSNGSRDIYDLTVVIVAVASLDHRATAIGYQRFDLRPGDNKIPINFGNTLPPGGYVIHADAIAEVAAKDVILRQRLQSPQALQIAAGP